jgi:broad specificity phosphatase PhoE
MDEHEPTVIYAPGAQAEMETAELIADRSSIRIRTENGLSEIDYGLWQGLKVDEIKRRQPRLQKQWLEAPSGVRPPGGETLAEAQERVWNTVVSIVKKNRNEVPVLVMRPVVLGLLRCRMLGVGLDDIWGHVREDSDWSRIEVEDTEGDVMMTEEKTKDG